MHAESQDAVRVTWNRLGQAWQSWCSADHDFGKFLWPPVTTPAFFLNTHGKWDSLFLCDQNNINYLNIAIITLGILIGSFRKDVKLLLWRENCPLMHHCLWSMHSGTIVIEDRISIPWAHCIFSTYRKHFSDLLVCLKKKSGFWLLNDIKCAKSFLRDLRCVTCLVIWGKHRICWLWDPWEDWETFADLAVYSVARFYIDTWLLMTWGVTNKDEVWCIILRRELTGYRRNCYQLHFLFISETERVGNTNNLDKVWYNLLKAVRKNNIERSWANIQQYTIASSNKITHLAFLASISSYTFFPYKLLIVAYHLDDLVEVLSFSWTKGERYINVMSLILIYKLYLSLLWVYWGEGRQTETNKTRTKKLLFVDSRLKRFLETPQTEETV